MAIQVVEDFDDDDDYFPGGEMEDTSAPGMSKKRGEVSFPSRS